MDNLLTLLGPSTSKCGYCSSPDTSKSFAAYVQHLTPEAYQKFLDLGWSRSGLYFYKPDLESSCCPQYTIRLPVREFEISKSQKKVIRKLAAWIRENGISGIEEADHKNDLSVVEDGEDFLIDKFKELEAENVLQFQLVKANYDEEVFALYKKYHSEVHPSSSPISKSSFTSFQITNPISPYSIYGNYQSKIYLNGVLVAVDFIDLLPNCVVTNYFIWDPEYRDLKLGVVSALRGIALTKYLKKVHMAFKECKWYYMGYYIHTCPKMSYKAQYKPSELLCQDSRTYIPLNNALPFFDSTRAPSLSRSSVGNVIPIRNPVWQDVSDGVVLNSTFVDEGEMDDKTKDYLRQFFAVIGFDEEYLKGFHFFRIQRD